MIPTNFAVPANSDTPSKIRPAFPTTKVEIVVQHTTSMVLAPSVPQDFTSQIPTASGTPSTDASTKRTISAWNAARA
jgi:hypothetical protein